MIPFQVSLWNAENTMSHLHYFDEESEENRTCDNEVFHSSILHQRKKWNIFRLQLSIYYIQYKNRKSWLVQMRTLQKWSKRNRLSSLLTGGCNAYSFSKIPERKESFPSSQLLWASAQLLVSSVSLIYLVDEFFFLFLVQRNGTRRQGESKVLSLYFWC